MNLIDIIGIVFVAGWFLIACKAIHKQKKSGGCIGCSGCSGGKCSHCDMQETP